MPSRERSLERAGPAARTPPLALDPRLRGDDDERSDTCLGSHPSETGSRYARCAISNAVAPGPGRLPNIRHPGLAPGFRFFLPGTGSAALAKGRRRRDNPCPRMHLGHRQDPCQHGGMRSFLPLVPIAIAASAVAFDIASANMLARPPLLFAVEACFVLAWGVACRWSYRR